MVKELFPGSTDFTVATIKIPQISKHFSAMLLFLSVFDFLGHQDPHFQEIGYFLGLLELWGLLFIKGPVKLIKRVKIAHSFLQSVSNQFHLIILSLPV